MEKKNTKLFRAAHNAARVAALIALLTAAGGGLYATPKLFNSAQKQATATQFWSDADLFLTPGGYTAVDFEKWFGVVSFQSDMFATSQTQMMQLGFAARFGDLYTALYYGGNTLNIQDENYTEVDGKRDYPGTNNLYLPTSGRIPYNEASLLIGAGDMGFRLSYVQTYRSRKLNDFYVYRSSPTGVHYESFTDEYGSINPEIAWGITKALIPGRGLQPHVYVDMDFFRDYRKSDVGGGELINKSNNEFTLGFTAAAGYVSLFEQNGFDLSVDLWYTGNFKFFNNEYTPQPSDPTIVAYKGKPIQAESSWDDDTDYYRVGYNDHSLTPYLCASWSGDKVSLSAELGLGLGLVSEKGSQFDLTGDDPIKEGFDFKATTFSFIPNLDLGLQWAIVPDKFYLNAGGSIEFFTLDLKTSTIDTYNGGDKVGDTVKDIEKTFGGASTKLMLGFTFNPTANLGVQAMSGIDTGLNSINVFSSSAANGLAVFSKIMVTLKF